MEEFWAYEFLSSRNVSQTVIQNMIDDKIDCEAVDSMKDEDMKRYLYAYGDRVSFFAYARIRLTDPNVTPASDGMPPRRDGAMARVPHRHGNKHAKRSFRRVELGWWNTDLRTRLHKQVRSANGGGTRHLQVDKGATMAECLSTAKSIFFPSGRNRFGQLDDFCTSVRDFKGDPVQLTKTVEQLFTTQHMKTLRLHLYSSRLGTNTPTATTTTSTVPLDTIASSNATATTSTVPLDTIASSNATATTSTVPLDTIASSNATTTTSTVPLDTIASSSATTTTSIVPLDTIASSSATTTTSTVPLDTIASSSLPDISSDEFEEAGTPTVFVRRHNLSRATRRQGHATVQYVEEQRPRPTIDVIDSEDEELQRAIDASMADIQAPNRDRETMPLNLVLQQVERPGITSQQQRIVVNRRHVLDSALRALQRPNFNSRARIYIKFSGEMGLDHGGPRREFFRLALQELGSSSYFEGCEGNKFFAHNLQSLEKEEYRLIGNLVALSIVHDGPGLNTLNSSLASMVLGLEASLDTFDLDHLPNPEVKDILQKLRRIATVEDLDRFKVDHGDWLLDQGYTRAFRMKVEDVAEVSSTLLKQAIYYRTSAEITQFTSGLEQVFGLWTVMKANPEVCLPLLSKSQQPLSKLVFMDLFQPIYSPVGSNRRVDEEETIYSWEMFLQDIEEKEIEVSFEELLVFVTGADAIPPCGFATTLSIEFYDMEDGSTRLPYSSTCTLALSLPRGLGDPEVFKPLLIRSLKESSGFGKM